MYRNGEFAFLEKFMIGNGIDMAREFKVTATQTFASKYTNT